MLYVRTPQQRSVEPFGLAFNYKYPYSRGVRCRFGNRGFGSFLFKLKSLEKVSHPEDLFALFSASKCAG